MFRIKICGITNEADVRAAVDGGADAIGLNFFSKSRRFVDATVARQIANTVPKSVLRVGVFVNHTPAEIEYVVNEVGLDCIQLHGDEPAALLAELPCSHPIVRAFRCGREGLSPLAVYLDVCRAAGRLPDAVLIDADAGSEYGGTGERANWACVAQERTLLGRMPLILAGGLTPQNVAQAIALVRPDGVDVASGVELEAGRKDATLVHRFVSVARQSLEA